MPYVEGQERQSLVLVEITVDDHGKIYPAYLWWCPGCASFDSDNSTQGTHMFHIPPWTFDNDNMDAPSFSASYLTHAIPPNDAAPPSEEWPNGRKAWKGHPRCHSFVKDGMIQYLSDCDHELAGQTVPMVPVPDWLRH